MGRWNKKWNYDFFLELSAGRIPGNVDLIKFGEKPSSALNTLQDIWDFTENLYTFQSGVVEHFFSSSNAGDTQSVVISGLGEDKREKTLIINLQGQTKVSIGSWYRINRAYNNDSTDLLGNIYIYEDDTVTAGVPDTDSKVRTYVSLAEQQTLMCITTVPIDEKWYLIGTDTSFSKKQSVDIYYKLVTRENGKVFRNKGTFGFEQSYRKLKPYIRLEPLTDIKLQTFVDTADTRVDGKLFIIKEKIA